MLASLILVVLLTSPWLIARLRGVEPERRRTAGLIGAGLVFAFTGVGHFIETEPMTAMLPDMLPSANGGGDCRFGGGVGSVSDSVGTPICREIGPSRFAWFCPAKVT